MTFSFTEKEWQMIIDYITGYMDTLRDEEVVDYVTPDLENGLGSALYKLYKGYDCQTMYEQYAKKRDRRINE